MYKKIELNDKELEQAINLELKRQMEHVELIASENYVSEDVLKATGSILTNKYAEGFPGKRYYGGCEYVDLVENLAIERAKKLFNVEYVNVQAHSGSSANAAALAALAAPGSKILGMSLSSGGHLTHGYKINFSGKFYSSFTYDVDENGYIDYEKVRQIAHIVKPQVIITGYSAYAREIDFVKFKQIADEVKAKLFADISHIAGLVAAKEHSSPVGIADLIMTTTHKTLRGSRGAILMTHDPEIAKSVDKWIFPGYQGGPLMHSIAGKAVAFKEALDPKFIYYAKQVKKNAKAMAAKFMELGVPVVTGGTDNHLFTINVDKGYGLSGKEAETIFESINITTNKNTIPFDTRSPMVTSGIRIGSPAMTSRGLKEKEFIQLATIMDKALRNHTNEKILKDLKIEILSLVNKFEIPKKY
ncbi:glycine hydroxymethyltransferase [Mycoplasma testudineum]|uniref:Serine hydroxymethyltransferase n=1 Tax=Mycoplasma testudineum TaxID=244584 RepID=A0A4R6IDY4_9MOLU|nr:serine hydroxymethyltransferase [Mycoplasma testudineum]OYD26931.1 serine hydroxymethyltransferase [Mycoplasma testudineum]TDO20480.1 glycine hydroxymethyltransferase [Mycoplasma testudineum]